MLVEGGSDDREASMAGGVTGTDCEGGGMTTSAATQHPLRSQTCLLGDGAIQKRFAAGNETALAECEHRFGPLLLAYAHRYVGPNDAEDVVQTVMIEAWRGRHRYDPSRSLQAWLFAIVRRRCIDVLRTRKTTIELDAIRELAGDDGREIADRFAWVFDLCQALGELPGAQRDAILLAYIGGMPQPEIASRLGVPLGTIKTRTARGLTRLADLLGQTDPRPGAQQPLRILDSHRRTGQPEVHRGVVPSERTRRRRPQVPEVTHR